MPDSETNAEKPRFFDRLLPHRSFRRAGALTVFCVSVAGGVVHYEASQLKDSQETKIEGVRSEVSTQGNNINGPMIVRLDEAKAILAEGDKKLDVCYEAAKKVGIDLPGSGDQAAGTPPSTESTTTTATSTTVPLQP